MAAVVVATEQKHRDHLEPILEHLPELAGDDVALTASYGSVHVARRRGFRRIVLAQHGAGQSYAGDDRSARNGGYPGGDGNEDVGLFLVPNEYSAWRWQERYPAAAVRVVGSPRLDRLYPVVAERMERPEPVVAVSFHWNAHWSPEAGSAWAFYWPVLRELAERFHVIGHGHPMRRDLAPAYAKMGIEYVASFVDVVRRADVYVCDNSSTIFEFAALGRPVVLLNAPTYRPAIRHGGRFWDWASVGPNVSDPADLVAAIEIAIADPPTLQAERQAVLERVYQPLAGGAELAARAIAEWAA